ncbi:MAG: YkgJ family cysteine cluster protein [Desulfatibacillum sp.]|nr:YkgJ family cysteine cluster protein [Desulfatibacillum sp.]
MNRNELKSTDIFECTLCGKCCQGYGGTYVTEQDIQAIAEFIGESPETVRSEYCQTSCHKPVLAQGEDGKCIFFTDKCSIHPVKPWMCRQWPFLKAVLKDEMNWRIMADCCPGCKGDVPIEHVKAVITALLAGEIKDIG